MLLNKKLSLLVIISLLTLPISYAQICEVARTKDVLRKNLYLYLTNPSASPLTLNEVKDLLTFYIGISQSLITVDCSALGSNSNHPISNIINSGENVVNVVPSCSDGTRYGECSTNKPKYCYGGSLINRCGFCGCPSGNSCDVKSECKPTEGNIVCFNNLDCGYNQFTGNYYCSNNWVTRNHLNYTCINSGTPNASCVVSSYAIALNYCNPSLGKTCVNGYSSCNVSVISQPITCSDGTQLSQCSSNKPLYCSNGTLINNCFLCSCSGNQTCSGNGSCAQTTTCTENWNCTQWSSCVIGRQTRNCTDSNNCGTTVNKPIVNQSCVAENETSPPPTITLQGGDGTWCYDPDGYGKSYSFSKGFCQDTNGTHYDFCEGNMVRDWYCTGRWNGVSWNNVRCSAGGYACNSSGYLCTVGKCTSTSEPDLIVSDIKFIPSNPTTTDPVLINITVKNIGRTTAGSSYVKLELVGFSGYSSQSIRFLLPGSSYTVRLSSCHPWFCAPMERVKPLQAGTYTYTATADADVMNDGEFVNTEVNENNNVLKKSVTVS